MSALALDVEYGVRFQIPGEHTQTKPVGSRRDAEDLIHQLWLDHGITGQHIGRRVGQWEEM